MTDKDKIHRLAQTAYEAHEMPESLIIDDQDGFESTDNGTYLELSRRMYYFFEGESEEEEETASQTAYFNVRIEKDTLDIGECYCIASAGGVMVGTFTEESRNEAYSAAGVADPRTGATSAP